jgi:CRP-like cAMP-binding protein
VEFLPELGMIAANRSDDDEAIPPESRPEAGFAEAGQVIAKISQEALAEMIGTTRARVSHFMNKFRKLGLIDYKGEIHVHSSLLNMLLHDEPEIRS